MSSIPYYITGTTNGYIGTYQGYTVKIVNGELLAYGAGNVVVGAGSVVGYPVTADFMALMRLSLDPYIAAQQVTAVSPSIIRNIDQAQTQQAAAEGNAVNTTPLVQPTPPTTIKNPIANAIVVAATTSQGSAQNEGPTTWSRPMGPFGLGLPKPVLHVLWLLRERYIRKEVHKRLHPLI